MPPIGSGRVEAAACYAGRDLAGSLEGSSKNVNVDYREAGTPMYVLQERDGWESPEMVQRYARLSVEHLAEYVERVSGSRLGGRSENGHSSGHISDKGKGPVAATL